jgi:hypothetical protein
METRDEPQEKPRSRMTDQTGRHVYHVFADDECLNNYKFIPFMRLLHSTNIDAFDWSVKVKNIREGTLHRVVHHCSHDEVHSRTPACYGEDLHDNYYICWEPKGQDWVRCGEDTKVKSVSCNKHQNDEMRKVLDNNPYRTATEEPTDLGPNIQEEIQKSVETIGAKLENGEEIPEDAYVHSKLSIRAEEEERARLYRQKDTKEIARAHMEAISEQDPDVQEDAGRVETRYQVVRAASQQIGATQAVPTPGNVRVAQALPPPTKEAPRIPALDEKARQGAKVRGVNQGSRQWNGNLKGQEQHQADDVKNEVTDDTSARKPKGRAGRALEKIKELCGEKKKKEKTKGLRRRSKGALFRSASGKVSLAHRLVFSIGWRFQCHN